MSGVIVGVSETKSEVGNFDSLVQAYADYKMVSKFPATYKGNK